jgi:hypothetical protein
VARALVVAALATACGGGDDDGGDLAPVRATPSGKAISGDDFAANALRWEELDEGGLVVKVQLGALVVTTSRAGEPVVSVPGRIDHDIFDAETAVSLTTEDADTGAGEYGVVCRNDGGRFYAFTIDDGGDATIALWEDGVRTVLGRAPYRATPQRVAGRCIGGVEGGEATLELIIDGIEVVSATDETALAGGTSGVFAAAASSSPLTASFDRFEVRELDGGTTHLAPPPPFPSLPEGGLRDDFAGDDGPFGELLIEDDLGGFLAQYDGGTYRMRADGFVQRSAPVDPMPDHAAAEVTVRKVSSGPSFRGLRWAKDEDHYYEVAIDDGVAVIGYVDGDRDGYVELARADDVSAIADGDAPNRLRTEVDRREGRVHITLAVNATPVLEATDDDRWQQLHFSQLFMRSTDESTEPTEVRFDDYSLTAR